MKLGEEEARQRVFNAMLKANGDRDEAARVLGVSLRTLYRYLEELKMLDVIEQMGWKRTRGPAKGTVRGAGVVRMQILDYLRTGGGAKLDFGALTVEIFGEDDRAGRSRVYSALEQLRKDRKVDVNEDTGVWSVLV